jgi:hypothetical protein
MALTPVRKINVIAFVGKAGSGKTTAAKYLVERNIYRRLSFSDGLKKMLSKGLDIPNAYLYGDSKNEPCEQLCGRTARHAMITLGTEWGRDMIHPDIWVNTLTRDMITYIKMGIDKIVIDDVRFLNEANWVKSLNEKGMVARIIRILRGENKESTDHRSEIEQDGIEVDWEIWNNDTVESMCRSIDGILYALFDKEK